MAVSLDHPVCLFLSSFLIDVFILSFTSPSSSLRLACFPLVLCNLWLMLRSERTVRYTHPMYANLLGGSIFTMALQYFNLAIVRRSSYEAGGPTTTPEGQPLGLSVKTEKSTRNERYDREYFPSKFASIGQRIKWGLSFFLNTRMSGTPWEVKNVPPFSKHDAAYVPSKSIFLRRNALQCLISVLLLDLCRPSKDTSKNYILFADNKIPVFARLSSVTTEDLTIRLLTTTASTILTYLLFQAMYSFMAVMSVALGFSPPRTWRPLFGGISDAYSLRRAWSVFWHQGMASSLLGPAKWFVFGILRLRRTSLTARYILAVVVFVLSGAMHVCGEIAAGVSFSESGVIQFFATQALGFAIEDATLAMWSRVTAPWTNHHGAHGTVRWWQKVFGFVWVIAWFAWSMPVWIYPASQRSNGEGLLPFSIIDSLKGYV
jgi:hypothetical protein